MIKYSYSFYMKWQRWKAQTSPSTYSLVSSEDIRLILECSIFQCINFQKNYGQIFMFLPAEVHFYLKWKTRWWVHPSPSTYSLVSSEDIRLILEGSIFQCIKCQKNYEKIIMLLSVKVRINMKWQTRWWVQTSPSTYSLVSSEDIWLIIRG